MNPELEETNAVVVESRQTGVSPLACHVNMEELGKITFTDDSNSDNLLQRCFESAARSITPSMRRIKKKYKVEAKNDGELRPRFYVCQSYS